MKHRVITSTAIIALREPLSPSAIILTEYNGHIAYISLLATTIFAMIIRTIYWTVIATISVVSCNQITTSYDKSDIRGTWYEITNDSIYGEMIVTESAFYTYNHETFGDRFVKYHFDDDSLRFFWNGENSITYRFERIDENQFSLTHPWFSVNCYRLDLDIDTMKILSTKRSLNRTFDEEYFSEYVNGVQQRKFEWMEKNGSR